MTAALATLGSVVLSRRGRRIAVLGDMKELGAEGPSLHRALAEAVEANAIDLVFAAGSLMENLVGALPKARVAAHGATAADLVNGICATVQPGDAIMVKGSLSTGMGVIVKALKERFSDVSQMQAMKG
jgi:UDP-N-acetylmuramoyl-tripeptide--D-alanyl-D-alanine ligase